MELSTFELLYKPQSPAAPAGTIDVERVIQGYFLTISNLEDTTYRYGLEFVISPPPVGTPDQAFRSLANNTVVFIDTPGTDNQAGTLSGSLTSSVFRPSTGFITIPPNGTALVAVLPSAFGPNPALTQLLFEVRGFVRLTLPAIFTFNGPLPNFFREPQSDSPVKVMVTPQHRATFFTADGSISDQIQASLPVASGQALNELEPEPGGPLVIMSPPTLPVIIEYLTVVQSNPEMVNLSMLAAVMSQLDGEKSDLSAFNKALSEFNIPFAIERRNK